MIGPVTPSVPPTVAFPVMPRLASVVVRMAPPLVTVRPLVMTPLPMTAEPWSAGS